MSDKEKVVLYPFDIQSVPLLRHKHLLNNYDIVGAVSPEGWGLCGKDAGLTDCGNKLGIEVKSSMSEFIENCDTVFFVDSFYKLDFKNEIYPEMLRCIESNRNIINLMDIKKEYEEQLKELCAAANVCYKSFSIKDESRYAAKDEENIVKINTPVIFVMGLAERLNKFELQLALRERLLNLGYKVSQIGSRSHCEIMGFHSFPEFMYSTTVSEVEKIILFNRLVKQIELIEKPDAIVIGIPGGTMVFNNEYTNKFGIFAFEISQAVNPDFVVFSTLYEDFTPEYFKKISNLTKYKFGFDVDCFNLANTVFDWQKLGSIESDLYLKLSSSFIDEKITNFRNKNIQVYNILNDNDSNMLVENIIEKLSGYGELDII